MLAGALYCLSQSLSLQRTPEAEIAKFWFSFPVLRRLKSKEPTHHLNAILSW
jgi:hypothetical protein